MYHSIYVDGYDKDSYKEAIKICLRNIEEHIDENILNDFDSNPPANIKIFINVAPGEVAVYNVNKEYLAKETIDGTRNS